MDELSIRSPRDAAAKGLGQDAARAYFSAPVDGETMQSFVVGAVTPEIVALTRAMVKVQQSEIKAWRRRHFIAPIALAVLGIVTSVATTPRPDTNDSNVPYVIGFLGLLAGAVWLIVTAFRASAKLAAAQTAREVETGRLLEIARDAAAKLSSEWSDADAPGGKAEASREAKDGATASLSGSKASGASTPEADEAARALAREQRRAAASPPPPGQPFGVSQEGAEYLVAAWMRHLGESDAATAGPAPERRVGVASERYSARVVNDADAVGADAVRELVEAAAIDGRRPVFFAAGSFADDAHEVANEAAVTLLVYDAVEGTLEGANDLGRAALLDGLA